MMEKNDYLILESLINDYGVNTVISELDINEGLKDKLRKMAAAGLIGASIATAGNLVGNDNTYRRETTENIYNMYMEALADKAKNELDGFMRQAINNQNYNYSDCLLNSSEIIKKCIENEFDIGLLAAQANLESCFGMTNRCRRTNNVFSIGLYDNGKNVCTYDSQNASILPYIKTMKRDYMLNGKISVDELISDGNFVNMNGDRYASDKKYEYKVRNIRDRIFRKCPTIKKLSELISKTTHYNV